MAFFSDLELSSISIDQMVFHLVGPKTEDFQILEQITPGKFSDFFIERIRAVNKGLPYNFTNGSNTKDKLLEILNDPSCFQKTTEMLAETFQNAHGGNTAAGAFLIFKLALNGNFYFCLLKYDDELVLSYEMEDAGNGRKRVSLDDLERTFVQNRDALQKSALIRLASDGTNELSVLDRQNQQKVARYFETFLGAVRQFDDAEITEKMVAAAKKVIRENRNLVSHAAWKAATERTYLAASAGGKIAADDQKRFLENAIGQSLPDDHELVKQYFNKLKNDRIFQVPVDLDAKNVNKPRFIRYETNQDIRIQVPKDAENLVTVDYGNNRIIIQDSVRSEYDDSGSSR